MEAVSFTGSTAFTGHVQRDLGQLTKILEENPALSAKLETVKEKNTDDFKKPARKIPDWELPSAETLALMKGAAPHTVVKAFSLLKYERTVVFETDPITLKNLDTTDDDN